ncbi:MAG: PQQ-binding-like beta-propeller repeat protein [Acidobacteriota bacterium]
MRISLRSLLAWGLLTTLTTSVTSASERWDQLRGPALGGVERASALPAGDFGLTVAWTRELGSGYSNISIADGKAVTMFTDGEVDVVAAYDIGSGGELWRYELGEKYVGADPSTDGPLSTPTIAGSTVYVLAPRGRLAALDLADGAEQWRRDLNEEISTPPHFGYATSPLVSGDLVILATGGAGHSLTAFARSSGQTRWTVGDDTVKYQTPTILELGGREVLVAPTDQILQGIDPVTGELLWHLRHTEGETTEGSAHVTPVDDERFMVKYRRGAKLYQADEGSVEELWETNAFGNTYALPVRIGDHFYGFSGNFLTAVQVESGEIAWRSRPPGGFGLSQVGDTLAILSRGGDLVLVDPSPEGYQERRRIAALDAGDYAFPSFAGGTFLVRNQQRMAAVRLELGASPQHAAVEKAPDQSSAFGRWIASVEAMPEAERQAAVDTWSTEQAATPIVEGDLAHFIWRGEAKDVGLNGDPVRGGRESGLRQLAGTDLFHLSLELDPKAQYGYSFTVDFGRPFADPRNPLTVDSGRSVYSELRMPQWPASPHLEEPAADAPRGVLDTFQFRSEILDNTREVKLWRPAGYGQDPTVRYPLLVINDGDLQLRSALMQNTLDQLVGTRVAPLIAVFVPARAFDEYHGSATDDYARFLVEELVPHIDRHYLTDGATRAIMGPGAAGVTAVYAAVRHPQVFQRSATQSFYPIPPLQDQIREMLAAGQAKPEQVVVVWSRNDFAYDPARRADDASQALVAQLQGAGVDVTEHVGDYFPGWGGWRGQHDEILEALFPPGVDD